MHRKTTIKVVHLVGYYYKEICSGYFEYSKLVLASDKITVVKQFLILQPKLVYNMYLKLDVATEHVYF